MQFRGSHFRDKILFKRLENMGWPDQPEQLSPTGLQSYRKVLRGLSHSLVGIYLVNVGLLRTNCVSYPMLKNAVLPVIKKRLLRAAVFPPRAKAFAFLTTLRFRCSILRAFLLTIAEFVFQRITAGFSHANAILTKQRNRLNLENRGDLLLKLTNFKPNIKSLAAAHQAHPSH
ncbi:hypothetical protein FHG87_002943 [Trinorchestia longiramus]|nr:hypothetical protein FHG87_002943 [Trinorchestia longiramus]